MFLTALQADYGKLKKKVREYDVIIQNIDSILRKEWQAEKVIFEKEILTVTIKVV